MVWYRDLYVGRLIAFRRRKVVEGIEAGKYPAGVYVVILPESSSSQLEIMSAGELRHPWIRTHCRMIVAIAQGKMEAQGRGAMEILSKQAQGFMALVNAASGDPQKAVLMMIADRLPELVKTQVEAVKGINIDKVTVWDGSGSADGKTSTANFISGLMKSIPPMEDLFKMAGMQLPDYLKGKDVPEDQPKAEEQSK